MYKSGDNRVLFQDGVWKIGTLNNDLDCNTLSSVVEEDYRAKHEIQRPEDKNWWKIIKYYQSGQLKLEYWPVSISLEDLYNRVETRGLRLVLGTRNSHSWSKDECLR